MSISNAKKFIKRALVDKSLRHNLNQADNQEVRDYILKVENLAFTYPEFEEGYRNLLVNCQSYDQAGQVKELKMWWQMLTRL